MAENAGERIRERLDELYRIESRRILATLIRLLGDFDLAEDALHDAFRAALEHWTKEGVPANPRAWLVSTGRFKAIDAMRRGARFDASQAAIAERLYAATDDASTVDGENIEDDRLRLIFTCCHPALASEARVALTLREVCGLTTEEIARAFLASPSTLAQRIVRPSKPASRTFGRYATASSLDFNNARIQSRSRVLSSPDKNLNPQVPMHPQPLICVRDVEASSRWYQRLLGCKSDHGGPQYERLVSHGRLVLQLHRWDVEHHHGPIGDPSLAHGNGVLLWFEVNDFEAAVARAADLQAEIVLPRHRNPPDGDGGPNHWEVWLRDPDGYTVVLASPDGSADGNWKP